MDEKKNFDIKDVVFAFSGKPGYSCPSTKFPADAPVAMSYTAYQLERTSYEPEKALSKGTLFTCLDKPFYGRSVSHE